MPVPISVVYVTQSTFKIAENRVFAECAQLTDGTPVGDSFVFDIRKAAIQEVLEVDLEAMVRAEVAEAYERLQVPCIVEHAGLVFAEYYRHSYPGGLTKPMWNALGNDFVRETHSAGRRAAARAVVAYCDGKGLHSFTGETWGTIAEEPRGGTQFYWDTVFMPDDPEGNPMEKTYAEIIDDAALGLEYKMKCLSQSSRAMLKFLEYRRTHHPGLWSRL
jgi:XTP/dITP diphosphohydrolase